MGETFPIMDERERRKHRESDTAPLVRSLPWSVVEPWRANAERFHDQTLERLAERGGLSPFEAWCHAHGHSPFRVEPPTPDELRAWLRGLA